MATVTWEGSAAVRRAAVGLQALGLEAGDALACWLTSRPERDVAGAAAAHVGIAFVDVGPAAGGDRAEHLVGAARARVLVTEPAFLELALALRRSGRTALHHVVCVGGDSPHALGWDEVLDGHVPG